jgi:transcriptional regulator with XRE-family HTH domain
MDLNKEEKMLRIRFERLIRNWRQEDLAHFARVSVADISKIESGRMNPFPAHAQRLAEVLNLTPEQLTERARLGVRSRHRVYGIDRRKDTRPQTTVSRKGERDDKQ